MITVSEEYAASVFSIDLKMGTVRFPETLTSPTRLLMHGGVAQETVVYF
jgi:hypothetical protein